MRPAAFSRPPRPIAELLIWEAASRLGRAPSLVRRDIRRGVLPARKVPGRNGPYLIASTDLEAYARALEAAAR